MTTRRRLLATGAALVATDVKAAGPRSAASDRYFGVRVVDEQRWLEDWSRPEVRAWSEAQNRSARARLDKLPEAPALRTRLTELLGRESQRRFSGLKARPGRLFALLREGSRQQPLLVVMGDPDRPEAAQVVLDVLRLDPAGGTAIDWYEPSPDGETIAVSLSEGGSEQGALHIYRVSDGALLEPPIANVHNGTAGGDVAWAPDGASFYYTRYPRPGERPESELTFNQQVYHHTLGQGPALDRYELGRGMDRITEFRLQAHPTSGQILATAQHGDSGRFRFFLREANGPWRAFGAYDDGHIEARFGDGEDIFLATRAAAPRGRVLRISSRDLDIGKAVQIVPEASDGSALTAEFYDHFDSTLTVSRGRVILIYQAGGPTRLRAFQTDGAPLPAPDLPAISDVSAATPLAGGDILFSVQHYTAAPRWMRWDGRSLRQCALTPAETSRWDDVEVVREIAVSQDGARIPFTVLRMKGAGRAPPALLYGYGGYRASAKPQFRPELRALLERGFVYAEANLRGGAEFGEPWHAAGSGANKQNVFDDFHAVAERLGQGFADPRRIAITGVSNGGLLVGAVTMQRPERFAAVVAHVGIYDSLRNELDPNGVFNIPEFGSVRDPKQFKILYAYSPYHHVEPGRRYPPMLFMTGANDPRVNPMHSRKMVARLQAKGRGGPFLLRTSRDTGHGYGTPLAEQIEELVDSYAFVLAAMAPASSP